MAKLNTLKVEDSNQKILVYGVPKSGKSLLVGQLANHGYELYWLDGENGKDVLFQLPEEGQANINLFEIRDLPNAQEFAKVANEFSGYRNFNICASHGALNCVKCKAKGGEVSKFVWEEIISNPKAVIVFDSLSQLVISVQNFVSRNESFDDFGSITKESKRDWGHYNAQGLILGKFFTMIQNAPCKIVCISHESELDPEKNPNAKTVIPIGGTREQSKSVSKYFGHVVHCRLRNNLHGQISGTTSDPNVQSGSRLNVDISKSKRGLAELFEVSGQVDSGNYEKDAMEAVQTATPTSTTKSAAQSMLERIQQKAPAKN